jgi:UDP-N-acetylglucosamine 2-epimerase (non-hydrolysing)
LKVLTVLGTRPEAIKLAPVLRELDRRSDEGIRSLLCVTGQHRQMLDQVIHLFRLRPDFDLDVMTADQTPTTAAAAILGGLDPILRRERPDWVLVQGDTTTVAAAALAAFYAGCQVGHVEAGLRTFDRRHPFPEEINRKIATAIADRHFAPTAQARENLLREGVPAATILVTGNTGIDALHWAAALPEPPAVTELVQSLGLEAAAGGPAGDLAATTDGPRLILVTAHRRENLGPPLEAICGALHDLRERYGDSIRIVYPVHLNPNVREPVQRLLGAVPGIALIPPLDYLPLVHLLRHATLVLTDSGGIQEEAPSLGKPVLVLREVTERPEAVAAGTVRLVGASRRRIVEETVRLLDDATAYAAMARAVSPYGDGHASERIVAALLATQ